jgi:hypothetical protein
MSKETPLALIVRQLEQARRIAASERRLIARLKAKGRSSAQSERTLAVFEDAIGVAERQLAQLAEKAAPQPGAAARRPAAKQLQ